MTREAEILALLDRKYVARSDERQRAMGLAYITAERRDLAKEIARYPDLAPALSTPAVSGEWVSVPREPTPEMMRAFWLAGPYPQEPWFEGYRAMLAASPAPQNAAISAEAIRAEAFEEAAKIADRVFDEAGRTERKSGS